MGVGGGRPALGEGGLNGLGEERGGVVGLWIDCGCEEEQERHRENVEGG